jgi:ABC-2 type transport system ATP-binding protein
MPMIVVDKLVKDFGSFRAVDTVSFQVEKGEIFGLLGPNGAGKTTTIRMMTGILQASSGNIQIADFDIQKAAIAAKQLMGVVPEMANAYIDISALNNLLIMGELYGLDKANRLQRAEELLKKFQLYDKRQQKVKTFSKGMKQRLIIAMALMNDAQILFLDEPTSGLDVESVRLIRQLILEFIKQAKPFC